MLRPNTDLPDATHDPPDQVWHACRKDTAGRGPRPARSARVAPPACALGESLPALPRGRHGGLGAPLPDTCAGRGRGPLVHLRAGDLAPPGVAGVRMVRHLLVRLVVGLFGAGARAVGPSRGSPPGRAAC